jgi:hypothetical protein
MRRLHNADGDASHWLNPEKNSGSESELSAIRFSTYFLRENVYVRTCAFTARFSAADRPPSKPIGPFSFIKNNSLENQSFHIVQRCPQKTENNAYSSSQGKEESLTRAYAFGVLDLIPRSWSWQNSLPWAWLPFERLKHVRNHESCHSSNCIGRIRHQRKILSRKTPANSMPEFK